MFESILIANRGEIAVRIIRAARELGVRTIAIHSDADEGAYWTRLADEAHVVGPAPSRESYLNVQRIVDVARRSGARAVHPGYGLLSENADFATAVGEAGVAFIGPAPETIALMGDKVAARAAAIACRVPVLPGSEGPVRNLDEAMTLTESIGWPIVVKASFGGGGRGLRIAATRNELVSALAQASREAAAAFGRAEVFLERYLPRPRHVEVQILGDQHGRVVHLGDRDCSVQRRHQKLLEEAPAPGLSDALRHGLSEAAVRLGRSVHYVSAGTVEFLVDVASEEFYFLEMNTRVQVEHGVTEMVTGLDIVREQIRIAAGERLSFDQDDVHVLGHAIQARIQAEDPRQNFRPTPGSIRRLSVPAGPWVRSDFGVEAGDIIPQQYDSLFGKVQAWGYSRDEARVRLRAALTSLVVEGVPTTAPFLRQILEHPAYREVAHDTTSVERDWLGLLDGSPCADDAPTLVDAAGSVEPQVLERRVRVPWGSDTVEVAVYGAQSRARTEIRGGIAREGRSSRSAAQSASSTDGAVRAPMDAVVVSLAVTVGARVKRGTPLLVLEAMKMEVIIDARADGILEGYLVAPGDVVKTGAPLVALRADAPEVTPSQPAPS